MISQFSFRMLGLLSTLFFLFVISVIVVTIMVVDETQKHNNQKLVDPVKLRYVEFANWLFAGLLIFSVLLVVFASPRIIRLKSSGLGIGSTGLHPAKTKH